MKPPIDCEAGACEEGGSRREESSATGTGELFVGSLKLCGPFVLAPLAGVSDWPFRLLAREQGAAVAYTEMISSEGLIRKNKPTLRMLDRPEDERPFAPQIFGSDPERMALAAEIVASMGADLVDLNMGCPVKKVCRTGAGAALMTDPRLIEKLVRAVVSRVSIPVQVKVRTGWDSGSINVLQIARIVEDAGAAALAVHGRTRAQGYQGLADWEMIAEVKRQAGAMKVIGNGDVFSGGQAVERLKGYGVDGVMIGRGACGNPWIFSEATALLTGRELPPPPSHEEWRNLILRHLENLAAYRDGDMERAVRQLRKHLVWYTRGRRNATAFRAELGRLQGARDVTECLDRHFPPGSGDEIDRDAPLDTAELEKAWC